MSVLPPPSSPRAAIKDLVAVFRSSRRDRLVAGALAILITIIIVILFLVDSSINTAPPPTVIYVENYKAGRTDADIIADQKKDSAARHAYAKEKQRQFQKLEKKFGIE